MSNTRSPTAAAAATLAVVELPDGSREDFGTSDRASLMIDFNVGVTTTTTYTVKKLDFDYFGEE